jgi:uncharacterized damage-inducible protein DinB
MPFLTASETKMSDIGQAFIARSQHHLAEDFLPKIERCIGLLKDEQIWRRANEQSNSIGNLLLHLNGNVRQWIVCGLGDGTDGRDRDAEFAQRGEIPRAEMFDGLKRTVDEAVATLARLDPDKLLEKHRIQGLDVSALECVLHVVEHFSMHTGQIILLAKTCTEVDLEFYDFSGSTPVPKWKRGP